ncbi:MAG: hypothetical protein IPJ89_02170 [Candidatus Iainarchaeum archaeon]|uniref:Uncharacterized protein n=1 Tax=Candidatus Iainarchaeum sp. TaxID=3101447 RepID=A0A7T9DKL4_9ARCH|nr:MAG: hypothetical protein IPJ89_02170 [Candidatus Diapherotrites archaeon]
MLFITQHIKRLGTLSVLEWSMLKTALIIFGIGLAKWFPPLLQVDWAILIGLLIVLYAIPLRKIFSEKGNAKRAKA